MATPEDIIQRVILDIQATTEGIAPAVKSLGELDHRLQTIRKHLKAHDKTVTHLVKQTLALGHSHGRAASQITRAQQPLRQNIRLLQSQTKEAQKSTSAFAGLGRSILSIGALVAGGSITALATRQISRIVDSRLSLAVTGGPGAIGRIRELSDGIPLRRAIDLVARFQGQGAQQRFGQQPGALRGLLGLQREIGGIGQLRARDLILEVTKSLEPDKLREFLQTAQTDVEGALLGAASGQNIVAITEALNALQLTQSEQLDPVLKAAIEFQQASDKIASAFEKFVDLTAAHFLPAVDKFSDAVKGFSDWVSRLRLPSFLGGQVRADVGAPRSSESGFLKKAAFGSIASVIIAGQRIKEKFVPPQSSFEKVDVGINAAALLLTKAIPAVSALSSAYTISRGIKGSVGLGLDLRAQSKAEALTETGRRASIERGLALFQSSKEVDRLKGERFALLAKTGQGQSAFESPAELESARDRLNAINQRVSELLPKTQTVTPAATKPDVESIAKMSDEFSEILTPIIVSLTEKAVDLGRAAATAATKGLEALRKNIEAAGKAASRARLEQLQQRAVQIQQLALTAGEQASVTAIKRLELQLAKTQLFGGILSGPQVRELVEAIRQQISILEQQLKATDTSTREGRMGANQIRQAILRLQIEERQSTLDLRRAILDSEINKVFRGGRSGAFANILLTNQKNVAAGLRLGIFRKDIPEILGEVGVNKGIRPRDVLEVLQQQQSRRSKPISKPSNVKDVAEGVNAAADILKKVVPMIQVLQDAVNPDPEHTAGQGQSPGVRMGNHIDVQ